MKKRCMIMFAILILLLCGCGGAAKQMTTAPETTAEPRTTTAAATEISKTEETSVSETENESETESSKLISFEEWKSAIPSDARDALIVIGEENQCIIMQHTDLDWGVGAYHDGNEDLLALNVMINQSYVNKIKSSEKPAEYFANIIRVTSYWMEPLRNREGKKNSTDIIQKGLLEAYSGNSGQIVEIENGFDISMVLTDDGLFLIYGLSEWVEGGGDTSSESGSEQATENIIYENEMIVQEKGKAVEGRFVIASDFSWWEETKTGTFLAYDYNSDWSYYLRLPCTLGELRKFDNMKGKTFYIHGQVEDVSQREWEISGGIQYAAKKECWIDVQEYEVTDAEDIEIEEGEGVIDSQIGWQESQGIIKVHIEAEYYVYLVIQCTKQEFDGICPGLGIYYLGRNVSDTPSYSGLDLSGETCIELRDYSVYNW